ncbi:MAG: AHH domain-containing protein [Planctomycetota bacterium]|jgi:hypothetical protein
MPEIGEIVAVPELDQDENKCPCDHEKTGEVDNSLHNSGSMLGTRLKNGWSTKLWDYKGNKVVSKKKQQIQKTLEDDCKPPPIDVDDNTYPYSRSAHHLIPGNASLRDSNLMAFIKKGDKIFGDIGYDVNGAENGIWLPTHAALSTEMAEGKLLPGEDEAMKYAALTKKVEEDGQENPYFATFQQRYTFNIMKKTNRQFHDAHPDYNIFVSKVLEKINVNLINISSGCKECKKVKSPDGKLPPYHQLVNRLNSVSSRLRPLLLGSPVSWRPPVFTSRFAAQLAADYWAREVS